MDPIKTIGQLLKGNEERDAIHIAILPVVAGEELHAGEPVTLAYGTSNIAIRARDDYGLMKSIGIADPFLRFGEDTWRIKKGQRLWVFLHPNTITGIRHEWHHPRVDNPPQALTESEKWLREFSERWGFSWDEMIEVATNPQQFDPEHPLARYQDWIVAHGTDLHSREELGEDHDKFWQHMEVLTGRKYDPEHRQKVQWSCTC